MPYSTYFGTGFEMGTVPLAASEYNGGTNISVTTSNARTGSYCVRFAQSWIRFPFNDTNEIYGGLWFRHDGYNSGATIYFNCTGGTTVSFAINSSGVWLAKRGSTLLQTGTISLTPYSYYNLQFHVLINSSTGVMQLKVNNSLDIDFTGNTDPGTSVTIENVQIYTGTTTYMNIDDITIGTGDWPGDRRFTGLFPNADTATEEWTPSTGSDSYAVVDETPPDYLDYLYTTTSGYTTILELGNFNSTGKSPETVTVWARGFETITQGTQLEAGVVDHSVESSNTSSLDTTTSYIRHLMLITPASGVGWNDSDIDSLQVFVRAHI